MWDFVSGPGKVVWCVRKPKGREKQQNTDAAKQHNTKDNTGAANKQQSTTSKYDNALLDELKM